ncbi:MAG: bifunctional folylpolyglutamate synthase/dihydrofolate synthase [Erysipelotrichaceae bacterium]|nr:bifunctional folylpolyglutamate synthase/dihydrofolate synthase [Erysipelotrichaceae bacterium]
MFTRTDEALKWIMERRNTRRTFDDFKKICQSLGDPQNDFYTIHVAGTDGKGSTVSYLCDLLMSQGYKVGTFTSPHYLTHLDRIRVDRRNIDEESFLKIINRNYDLSVENDLSMFEIDFLIMCEYFRQEKIDIAIVEVGLGGRLDYTNVIDNTKLSIITTIGYDHMDRLGDTLEEICEEKCGIIKNDSKVLIGHLDENCRRIVKQHVDQKHCELYELKEYTDLGERRFRFHDHEYELSSYASYQLHNASLALYALEIIAEDVGINIDQEAASKALRSSVWHCRFEIIHEDPRVILDGAHNIHGIQALCESFDRLEGSKSIIFSALKRKEYRKMIETLKEHCDRLIVTSFENKDVIDLNELNDFETEPDYQKAFEKVFCDYDNILICGSLYFMSDVVLNLKF